MFNPVATYRIQFHKDFTFQHLERIIPYLKQLGVKTIYASPVFAATPGSTHGYDGIHPHRINPEIGTEGQLRNIAAQLQTQDLNWLQDIVPNHMAFHPKNEWLMDVLEKGKESTYAPYFDIQWDSPVYEGKIMVPFLGGSVEEAIEKGELKLVGQQEKLMLQYYDSYYPVNKESVEKVVAVNAGNTDLASCIEKVNSDKKLLLNIVLQQHYRLCHWQETDNRINFRRFFTINGLICLNIQDERVFADYHKVIQQLVNDGVFQGLRIDHIDGLYDPTKYLDSLKAVAGNNTYVIVEKILQPEEDLPAQWQVEGSSGYDFVSLVNKLFTNPAAEERFTRYYQELIGDSTPVHHQIRSKKALILKEYMGGELDNLYRLFVSSELADAEQVAPALLKEAIGAFLVECPVYRYYGNRMPLENREAEAVRGILAEVAASHPDLTPAVRLLEETLLDRPRSEDENYRRKAAHFYMRCMQFSGPLMAKGVEDTLMYTYNRFIGHNDVGDGPESFSLSPQRFHEQMVARQNHWPLTMNTTSTHDTKRGEDVRARLTVLTELSDEWLKLVQEWQKLNEGRRNQRQPDANDEYFIYQTLVGAYPMPGADEDNFPARLEQFLEKALREAKINSNWTAPNADYETATKQFANLLLDKHGAFWKTFEPFHQKIALYGIVNSLSALLLKFTCPGIPDTYQGTEFWDLSLVDPDNRREVDYEQRLQVLQRISDEQDSERFVERLWENRTDPAIKVWLLHRLLKLRQQHVELFAEGLYIPLQVTGKHKAHVLAFARRHGQQWILVAVPLQLALLCKKQGKTIEDVDWGNTRIGLPAECPKRFNNILSRKEVKLDGSVAVSELFNTLPFAILQAAPVQNNRGAGILLAVSSLPSAFGIGDLGPEAKKFVDFLARSKQKYWQILPLNPTEAGAGHSPYSSFSSMGGNPLLISPELLVEEGLLDAEQLQEYRLPAGAITDYARAEQLRNLLLQQAYERFVSGGFSCLQSGFRQFCEAESAWLDDMALYRVLKRHQGDRPWNEWEQAYKMRQTSALESFRSEHQQELDQVKWLQFIFLRQWKALRAYANAQGIQLFGDMPFYVSYDSVDVWAHPELFCLDKDGNMTGMAGVPPDYFSEDGQLWGMPTFNWNKVKEQDYAWWVLRLRKNLELFDLLRIDHFRALQDYWQVPAGETTARNGEWLPGPRKEFFDVVERALGHLPFVAEDLGDKMEAVYALRDQVGLPGMKVLQFAWGDNMPESVDIPHNYKHNTIVYTGTHDNNTTIGWYKEETNKADHRRMHHYLGLKVRKKNIHEILARVAYASVARIAILPMQDILGLDQTTRMNTPGTVNNNWLWRLQPGEASKKLEAMLRDWVETFNR